MFLPPVPSQHHWVPMVMSMLERILSRGASAVMTLLLALFTGPEMVGKYATVILAMTAYQALADGVIRQVGVEAWNYRNGEAFILKSSYFSALIGFCFIFAACLMVSAWSLLSPMFLMVLPLVFVPIVTSLYLPSLTKAQRTPAGWKSIAKSQSIAAISSVVVAAPLLPIIGIGASASQVLLAEAVFLFVIRSQKYASPSGSNSAQLWRKYYFPTAVSSVLGWGQSQLERLVLVVFASSASVGVYSLAVSLARSASDAVTAGLVNAVRSQISTSGTRAERKFHLGRGIVVGLRISLVMQLGITLVCVLVLPKILNPSWKPALAVAPVFAATGVLAAVVWVASAYIISSGRSSRLLIAQGVGIALSIVCGYLLGVSLLFGAVACLVRDAVGMGMRLYIVRNALEKRTLVHLGLALIFAGVVVLFSQLMPSLFVL